MQSRYSAIYFGSTKDEVLKYFATFKEFLKTQTGDKVEKFHLDNSGECVSKPFKDFCAKCGIIIEFISPYSPFQNRIVEHLC